MTTLKERILEEVKQKITEDENIDLALDTATKTAKKEFINSLFISAAVSAGMEKGKKEERKRIVGILEAGIDEVWNERLKNLASLARQGEMTGSDFARALDTMRADFLTLKEDLKGRIEDERV